MNLPRRRAPWIMMTVRAKSPHRRADVVRSAMVVVPHQKSGHSNLVRFAASGCFNAIIRQAKKGGQVLNPNAAPIKQTFRSRRDLADDRCRVANLRRMIDRRGKDFEMPVEKLVAFTICCFREALVGEHQPAG